MSTQAHARATFEVDSWKDETFDERDGTKLGRAHLTKTFGGDVDGHSSVEILTAQAPQGSAAYVELGPLSLAIRVRVPWHLTSEPLTLVVRVVDADRKPVGPDPIVSAEVEVGRMPGQRAGDELTINLAIPLTGFPIQTEGTIFFHLSVADSALAALPLKIRRFPSQATPTL